MHLNLHNLHLSFFITLPSYPESFTFLASWFLQGYREKKMDMEENKAGEEDEMEGNRANHPEL